MFSASGETKSRYLKLKDGETMNLRFVEMMEKIGEPDQFSNPDGSFGEWSFTDLSDGSEKLYTNKSARNAVVIAMKETGVKEGDAFALTRKGMGPETRYSAVKLEGVDILKAMNPAPKDEAPF